MEDVMSFISIDWTIVFTWINTLILYLLLKKFLFKPVKKIMDEREQEVKDLYAQAEEANRKALELQEEYASHIERANEESSEILSQAYRKAKERSDQIVQEAQDKAVALMEHADLQIEREKKKALNELKDEISDISLMIASKVVQKELTGEDDEQLIAQFIDGVGDEKWNQQ